MSIYKTWTNIKCPDYEFSKTPVQKVGDLIIISDQKKFIYSEALKYLSRSQLEVLKKQDDLNFYSFSTETHQVHLFLYKQIQDTVVGGFESSDYNMFKKFFGLKLSLCETIFSLVLDPQFKLSEMATAAFAESLCSVSYNYKNKTKPLIKVGLESKLQTFFKNNFLKAQAVNFARFLVDLPPNILNPTTYSELIKELVKGSKFYKFESISQDLAKEGYGLITAVGQGSKHLPQLVRVTSSGSHSSSSADHFAGKSKKQSKNDPNSPLNTHLTGHVNKNQKIALVGKGITFDTGGLDLKPSKFMRNMKKDMGGSAAIVSVLYYLILSGQNHNVDFYIALAENSVGGNSFRPGDIHTAGNGLTVEIDNTDAEGRLVLADALSWLNKQKSIPEIVIDIATLTGAIKVGLGSYVGGLFSNDQHLSESLFKSSKVTGDFLWPMPMPYWTESEMTKSDVADLVNSSQSGYGGAITAAQFLKFFIPKKSKWAHLDIYSWVDGKKDVLRQSGGSGQGVLVLIDWLENQNRA